MDDFDNVFVTETPYHNILSTIIASRLKEDRNLLLSFPSFSNSNELLSSLRDTKGCPFERIENFESVRDGLPFRHISKSIKNIKMTLEYRGEYKNVFVFNDAGLYAQSLLYWSNQSCSNYVEDGTVAYSTFTHPEISKAAKLAGKTILGFWWDHLSIMGTYTRYDHAYFLYPNQARKEIQAGKCEKIEINGAKELLYKWAKKYIKSTDDALIADTEINTIIVLPHSDELKSKDHFQEFKTSILTRIPESARIGLKYHPRESDHYLSEYEFENETINIPKFLPVEFIYLTSESIQQVLGLNSTALVTAATFCENTDVTAVGYGHLWEDSVRKKLFDGIGILTIMSEC